MVKIITDVCVGLVLVLSAASASADCSWVMWQQDITYTDRWWIPKGWPFRSTGTESTPVARSEFKTLGECNVAAVKVFTDDVRKRGMLSSMGTPSNYRSLYACAAFGQRPIIIEAGGAWR